MLPPAYYQGWNYAIGQMSGDMESRKAFVMSLGVSESVEEYKSYGKLYYQGIVDAVLSYQANRKVPIEVNIQPVSYFAQSNI